MARNGTTSSNCWNADDTLKTHVVKTGGASSANCPTTDAGLLAHWQYSYDADGRVFDQVLSQAVGAGGGPVTVAGTNGYRYDDAGRLSQFIDENGTRTRTVQWDPNSNRTDFGVAGEFQPQHFDYNADDSIKQGPGSDAGRLNSTYDNAGRLTDDGCMAYTYDGFDRLTQGDSEQIATDPSRVNCKPEGVRFAYDGLDRQRSHTIVPASGPVRTTAAHFSGLSSSLTAVDATGTVVPAYRYALDADGIAKAVSLLTSVAAPEYLADDGTGNVTTITTSAAAVGCEARFDPFGNAQKVGAADTWSRTDLGRQSTCNTGTTANEVFYRGARHDVGSNTYQFGSRVYDPRKSAFLTPDSYRGPASRGDVSVGTDPLTRNSYSYVNGDPVNLTDPDGHISCPDGYCNWSANPNRKEQFRSTDPNGLLGKRVAYYTRTGRNLPNQWETWSFKQKKEYTAKHDVHVQLSAGAFDLGSLAEDAFKGYVNGGAGIANAVVATVSIGQAHVDPVFKEDRYRLSYTAGNVGGYTAEAVGVYGLGTVGSTLGNAGTRAYTAVANSRVVQGIGAAGTAVRGLVTRSGSEGPATAAASPAAATSTDVVRFDPEWASRQIAGEDLPGSSGYATTPAGNTLSVHAAERAFLGGPGRAPIDPRLIDDILEQGTRVAYRGANDTVKVSAPNLCGKCYVVVDAQTGSHVITVMVPK
jgi:RHS repeat-associated protein